MTINKISVGVSARSRVVSSVRDVNYTAQIIPDAIDRSYDITSADYSALLTAYHRDTNPAQLVFIARSREFAESVAAFNAQPAGGTLKSPPDWMLALHPFRLVPAASAPPTGSPDEINALIYGNFVDSATANATPPVLVVDTVTHEFTGLTDGWALYATDPPAGQERFAVTASAALVNGIYQRQLGAIYQETNSNLSIQYSADGISDWVPTRASTHEYFRIHIGTGWGPPVRFGFGTVNQRTTFLTTPTFSATSATEASPLYMSTLFTPNKYHTMIFSCFTYGGGVVQSLDEVRFSPGLIKARPDLTSQGQTANTMLVSRAADRQWGVSLAATAGTGSIIGRALLNWDINTSGAVTRMAITGVYPNNAAFKLALSGIRK